MQKVPFCKGLVGIEAVVEARLSRMAGSGKGEGFPDGPDAGALASAGESSYNASNAD